MLFRDMAEPCATLLRTAEADSEGGFHTVWEQGGVFAAALVYNGSAEADTADKRSAQSAWTVTSDRPLLYHEVFKRLSDGKTFRATSSSRDGQTPGVASFQFFQCTAEAWEVPEDE